RAHPGGRETAGLSRTHIPVCGEERGSPGPPRFRCVVNSKPALKTRSLGVFALGKNLAPEIALQPCVKTDPGSIAMAGKGKDSSPLANFLCPVRLPVLIARNEKLIGASHRQLCACHTREHHSIRGSIGIGAI